MTDLPSVQPSSTEEMSPAERIAQINRCIDATTAASELGSLLSSLGGLNQQLVLNLKEFRKNGGNDLKNLAKSVNGTHGLEEEVRMLYDGVSMGEQVLFCEREEKTVGVEKTISFFLRVVSQEEYDRLIQTRESLANETQTTVPSEPDAPEGLSKDNFTLLTGIIETDIGGMNSDQLETLAGIIEAEKRRRELVEGTSAQVASAVREES